MTREKVALIGQVIALKQIVYALSLYAVASLIDGLPLDQASNPNLLGFGIGAKIGLLFWTIFLLIKGVSIFVRVLLGSFGSTHRDCVQVVSFLSGRLGAALFGRYRTSDSGQRP